MTAFISGILFVSSVSQANTVDLSIGGAAQYQWWKPAWNIGKLYVPASGYFEHVDNQFPKYPLFRQFMYGPSLSIRFLHNWEMSAQFFYGDTSAHADRYAYSPDYGSGLLRGPIYRKFTASIERYDMHADLGYYVLKYLKIFAGLQVELANAQAIFKEISSEFFHLELREVALNYTPELGVRFNIPLTEIVALLADISGTFQTGSQSTDMKNLGFKSTGVSHNYFRIPNSRYRGIGGKSSLACNIDIPHIDVALRAGAYFRVLKYYQKKSERDLYLMDRSLDQAYGVYFSASYLISFETVNRRKVWIPRPQL